MAVPFVPAADPAPTPTSDRPPGPPDYADIDPGADSAWEVGLIDVATATHLRTLRSILDAADTIPFTAGQLTIGRLRNVIGDYLPGSFRLPVEILDLLPQAVDRWLANDTYLLPHVDSVRPASPRSAAQLDLAVDCGAIEVVLRESSIQSFAPAFCVEQHGGKIRLIFDLRLLNAHLSDASFAANSIDFETLHDVPSFLEAAGARVAAKLDLRKAFWQVPVADGLAARMGVRLGGGRVGRWQVLPFGLAHAPRLFQTITNGFVARWRHLGIATMGYLDDILIASSDPATHARNVTQVVHDLRQAGLRISGSKAFLRPYTRIEFLGVLFDLPSRKMSIAASRLQRIADDAGALLDTGPEPVLVRDVLAILGRIQFASFVFPGLTFHRSDLLATVRGRQTDEHVHVGADARRDLRWWRDEAPALLVDRWFSWRSPSAIRVQARRGRPCHLTPDIVATGWTDASATGVGFTAGVSPLITSPVLEAEPLPAWLLDAPSAARELYGVVRVVETSLIPPGSAIRVLCDNASVASSVHGRSVSTSVARVGRRLLEVCLERDIGVDVEWLPRELLDDADAASRYTDGSLAFARPSPSWLRATCLSTWGTPGPDVELFACGADRASDSAAFFSRVPMPGSSGEAMSADWSAIRRGWAYPPFGLLRPILTRLSAYSSPPDILWLLPDNELVRSRLRHSYLFVPGPRSVLAPAGNTVTLQRPLVLCVPMHARGGAALPYGSAVASGAGAALATPVARPAPAAPRAAVIRPIPAVAVAPAAPAAVGPAVAATPPVCGGVRLIEVRGDAMADPSSHVFHCISARAEMAAGFARPVAQLCTADMPLIRAAARRCLDSGGLHPAAVLTPRRPADVCWAHLVTKTRGSAYPSLDTVEQALRSAFTQLSRHPVARVHMPTIGCGIDCLTWSDVRTRVTRAAAACPRQDGVPWDVRVFHL